MKKELIYVLMMSAALSTLACASSSDTQNHETSKFNVQCSKDDRFSTRNYDLPDFTAINVSNSVKVIYTEGNDRSVSLTGRTDWIDNMNVTVSGNVLKVYAKHPRKFEHAKKQDKPDGQSNFILRITAPAIDDIRLSGAIVMETTRLSPASLNINTSGATIVKADAIETQNLKTNFSGASKVVVKHLSTVTMAVEVSGASKMTFGKLTVNDEAKFNISGASDISLSAEKTKTVQMEMSGASKSNIDFKGDNLRVSCCGASKLNANVNCQSINVMCDGASKVVFSGTADKVEMERGSIANNIDTSQLNQF